MPWAMSFCPLAFPSAADLFDVRGAYQVTTDNNIPKLVELSLLIPSSVPSVISVF